MPLDPFLLLNFRLQVGQISSTNHLDVTLQQNLPFN